MSVGLILMWMIGSVMASVSSKRNRTKHGHSHHADEKIVGGWDVKTMTDYPYMVLIMMHKVPHCGASLLTTSFVVTACHCLADLPTDSSGPAELRDDSELATYDFLAGTVNIKTYDPTFQSRQAKSIHIHPKCGSNEQASFVYDIGLAKMQEPFIETTQVQPLKMYTWDKSEFLKKMAELFGTTEDNPWCTVAGWGDPRRGVQYNSQLTDRLKAVEMYVLTNEDCHKAYSKFRMFPDQFKDFDFSKYGQICAVSEHLDSSDCTGDSGGPFVCDGHIVGVVSYGMTCGTEDPSVYQTVSVLIDWCKEEFAGQIDFSDPALPTERSRAEVARQFTKPHDNHKQSNHQPTNSLNVFQVMLIPLIMRLCVG